MTHRDRVGGPLGRRGAAGDAGHHQGFPTPAPIRPLPVRPRDRNGGFPRLSAAHSFQTGPMACDAPHRRTMHSWPKTLGSRLYGLLSALLGIRRNPVSDQAAKSLFIPSC